MVVLVFWKDWTRSTTMNFNQSQTSQSKTDVNIFLLQKSLTPSSAMLLPWLISHVHDAYYSSSLVGGSQASFLVPRPINSAQIWSSDWAGWQRWPSKRTSCRHIQFGGLSLIISSVACPPAPPAKASPPVLITHLREAGASFIQQPRIKDFGMLPPWFLSNVMMCLLITHF